MRSRSRFNTSPNIRGLTAATLYPGIGLLETMALSVGRGTPLPFEILGAPYIDGEELARELNGAGLASCLRFEPVDFIPEASVYAGSMTQTRSALDMALAVASLLNGPILGLFLLAATRRTDPRAALLGMLAGLAAVLAVWLVTPVAWPWYAAIGSLTTLGIGSAVSAHPQER